MFKISWNVIVTLCFLFFQMKCCVSAVDSSAYFYNSIISNEITNRICYHSICQKSILQNNDSSLIKLNIKLREKSKTLRIVVFGDSVMDGK